MPAQEVPNPVWYAMSSTTDGKWALFDPNENEVGLTEKVRDACLFRKYKQDPKKESFRVVVEGSLQLKMEGKSIDESDEDVESSEISFVAWPGGDKDFVSITRL